MRKLVIAAIVLLPLPGMASQLVYTPINPSFGGNPLNGTFLLSKAQSQNDHRAPINEKTYAEKFEESLQRNYLNKLVREITDYAFDDADENNPLLQGDARFTNGEFLIEVITSNTDSLTVQITNTDNGDITVIEIPRFGG